MCVINLGRTHEYKTRDGHKAQMDHEHKHGFLRLFVGSVGLTMCCWGLDGLVLNRVAGSCPQDIVGPWVEPKKEPEVDWSKYPEYVKALAMDADRDWWWYTHRPNKSARRYVLSDEYPFAMMRCLRRIDHPKFFGSWEDSLCVRPGVEDEKAKPLGDVPWEKLPDWVEVVAYDHRGWHGYSYIPRPVRGSLVDPEVNEWSRGFRRIRGDEQRFGVLTDLPKYPGDWKDSVIIRPGRNPIRDHD